MTDQTLKNKLIEMVRQERQTERDLVASLSEETRNAVGVIDRWEVKNVITHIASAKFGFAGDLAKARQGQDITPFNNEYQDFNNRTFEQHQHASWDEVNAYADAAVEALITEVEQYTDSELQQPKLQTWMDDGDTVAGYVVGFALGHTYQHLGQLYAENGQPETAYALLESMVPLHQSLGAPPEDVAGSHYDIATTYTRVGRGDLAIPHLRAAMRDRPEMGEWFKQDRTFTVLRDTAEFQALYE